MVDTLYDRLPLKKVKPMTDKQYYVRGTTALLDAVGSTIRHIATIHRYAREEDRPDKTLFIITTDGMENSSRLYDYEEVKRLIEQEKEKYGWEFIFLGANIDAAEEAGRMGIHPSRAATFTNDHMGQHLNYETISCLVSGVRRAENRAGMRMALDDDRLLDPIRKDHARRKKQKN